MIYLDTSVALAHLLAEDRHPSDALWAEHGAVLISGTQSLVRLLLMQRRLDARRGARDVARTR